MLFVQDLIGNVEALTDFKELNRNRKVNGEKTISLTIIPTENNQHSFPMVGEEAVISFNDEDYVIKKLNERGVGNKYFKRVEAIHKFFVDMINKQQPNIHNGSMTFEAFMQFVFEGTGYSFIIMDSFNAQTFENLGKDNRLSLLKKGLERYQAEMEIVGKTQIRLKRKVGNDTDFQFRYGHNIKAIEKNVDTTNLATVIQGKGAEGITATYRSPNADIFGELDAPSVDDERFTSVESLLEEMKTRLQDTPEFSITIDFVDLRAAGYPYTVPNEGDRVFVIYEPMDNLLIETRIMEINEVYDYNLEVIKTNVTLANYKKTFAGTMFGNVEKKLKDIITDDGIIKYSVLDEAVRIATEALQSAQTELEFVNGIIARDKVNPNELVLFNSKGIGVSSDGGQTFPQAITGRGIVADLITVGTMLFERIKGGTLTLGGAENGNGRMVVLDENGESIADLDAQRGGFDRLYVGELTSPTVVGVNLGNKNFYVDPIGGSDLNDGSGWASPKKTIMNCLNSIPKYNAYTVVIYLHAGNSANIYESLSITGFVGPGTIRIDGQSGGNASLKGTIYIGGNTNFIHIKDVTVSSTESRLIGAAYTNFVLLESMDFYGDGNQTAVWAEQGAQVQLLGCTINGINVGVFAYTLAEVFIDSCSGVANHIGAAAQRGSSIRTFSTTFNGKNWANYADSGGSVVNDATPTPSIAPPPPPPPVETTKQIGTTSGNNWSEQGFWSNDGVKQGNYGYGNRRGCWFFGTSILDNIGSGRTILSMRVLVQRDSRGGSSGAQRHSLRAHGHTSQPGGAPSLSGEIGSINLGWGQSGWIYVDPSVYASFANGGYRGFGLYTGGDNYSVCSTACTLEISYK